MPPTPANPSRHRWFLLTLALWIVPCGAQDAWRFFAVGDVPYQEAARRSLEGLLRREIPRGSPFLVHLGDIKAGNARCTDQSLERTAELFRSQPVPVVYTPGDNEWTDCRRGGGYEPAERLAFLRRTFFGDPEVLRLAALGAETTDPDYPENYRFVHGGVLFATVHVVGSRNNRLPADQAALAEHAARSAANRRHLRRVTQVAQDLRPKAVVLLFHANPMLEGDPPSPAYRSFVEGLRELVRGYPGPVLAIHGDTHKHRFDQPLKDPSTGETQRRFTRLEVPGAPFVAGVWVSVDPAAEPPFRVELTYPDVRGEFMEQ